MANTTTIRFAPPQPCQTWDGLEVCGNPASVATLTYYSRRVDFFPVCEDCTRKMLANYSDDIAKNDGTISGS